MSSGDAVQQIKDRLSIIDVISPYVELHKAGRHFKGKSPFTSEKTPSFFVSPDRGMYYCFSTNQGGDMFTFVQTMEGVDFKEALRQLAEQANVELVPESPEKKTQRDALLAVLAEATQWFVEQGAAHVPAARYMKERGLLPATIMQWQIGYAPGPPHAGWRELRQYLQGKGFSDTDMLRAGLIKTGQSGKEPFDVFRDRVMFAMRDQSGRPVAFSGRLLHTDTEAPKYVNSPETEVYHKSSFLFGYDMAKQAARQFDFWLLVEGQLDVVLAHQAGYSNTVAVSGTALTPHHVQMLERLSSRVVLALDADKAGLAAMVKAAQRMLPRGMDVKVAQIPAGQDPADMIVTDAASFKAAVREAVHVIEYMLHMITQDTADARTRKLKVHAEVLPLINLIPNRVDQEHFEHVVATAIDTTKEAIHFEIERLRPQQATSATASSVTIAPAPAAPAATNRRVLQSAWHYIAALQTVVPEAERKIIISFLETIPDFSEAEFAAAAEAGEIAKLTFSIETFIAGNSPRIVREEMAHRLNQFRAAFLKERVSHLRQQIQVEEQSTGEASVATMERLLALQQALRVESTTSELFD